jgi:hypothetical protein
MRSVQGKTVLAFDIDQRKLVPKRRCIVRVEQHALQPTLEKMSSWVAKSRRLREITLGQSG